MEQLYKSIGKSDLAGMYIAMSEHATTRSKCARLIKSKMQVDTMNHHNKLA